MNYPDDCEHKQCPWDEPEPVECRDCAKVLDEDELKSCVCVECTTLEEI